LPLRFGAFFVATFDSARLDFEGFAMLLGMVPPFSALKSGPL
jgi:hypothetical protein